MDALADPYLKKAMLCVDAARQLPHDAAKMLLSSINNAVGTRLSTIQDFEAWIKSLEQKDMPIIDMAAKMLGIESNHEKQNK